MCYSIQCKIHTKVVWFGNFFTFGGNELEEVKIRSYESFNIGQVYQSEYL